LWHTAGLKSSSKTVSGVVVVVPADVFCISAVPATATEEALVPFSAAGNDSVATETSSSSSSSSPSQGA